MRKGGLSCRDPFRSRLSSADEVALRKTNDLCAMGVMRRIFEQRANR